MNHSKHLIGCGIALLAGLVLVGIFNLPIGALALLACPLMMVLMMGSHGKSDTTDDTTPDEHKTHSHH